MKYGHRTAWVVGLLAAVSCGGETGEPAAPSAVAVAGSSATRAVAVASAAGMSAPVRAPDVSSATAGSPAGAAEMSHAVTGAAGLAGAAAAGAGVAGHAAASAGVGAAAPTLSQVYVSVFAMSCAVCHSMTPSDNKNGMLGMIRSQDQFYDALVNKPAQGTKCAGKGAYVVPGKPQMSLLVQKVSAAPSCGAEMPLGGMLQPTQAKLISDWIAAGAMKN